MLDFKEIKHFETWELFARDFLQEMGFYIESDPARGADAGKDILVSETIEGTIGNYKLKWLVSCKHYAGNGSSINEQIEQNILERVQGYGADGFIGIYSTIASTGLSNRLHQLKQKESIKDFRIFDHKLIENYLINIGFSNLLMRYFPEGYKLIKPLHVLFDKYYPLECEVCGKDLLISMFKDKLNGLVGYVTAITSDASHVEDVYVACKGICDQQMETKFLNLGKVTAWQDLKDLANPALYLNYIIKTITEHREKYSVYSDDAFKKEKIILMKMGQKVFQELNLEERKRVDLLTQFNLA